MSDAPEILPDYPPVIRRHEEVTGIWNNGTLKRMRPFLIHTRAQAEAGKIHVAGKRIPHHGRTDEKQREA